MRLAALLAAVVVVALPPGIAAANELGEAAGGQATVARSGPSIEWAVSPRLGHASSWPSVCSFRHALCVHPAPGTPDWQTAAVLLSADRAWDALVGVLGTPPPDAGLDDRWRVFVVDGVDGGGIALPEARDPIARFDRASTFALVDRATPPGCELDLAVARAVAGGLLWRAAPATDQGSARAQTETLARLAVPCAAGGADSAAFQARPERALVDPRSAPYDRGGALFFDWLDRRFGAEPGALVAGVWALAATVTPSGAANWNGTPTGFDVLRVSLKSALWQGSTLEDAFVRFAVARVMASPSPQIAWHVPWPLRPRRVASPEPVSPTGAAYVLIEHAGAPPGARLRLEMEWEDYARISWSVLKLDHEGSILGELAVTSLEQATRTSMTVESLDGVDRIMVLGVGLPTPPGSFDPDQTEWEPHGWLLTVEAE